MTSIRLKQCHELTDWREMCLHVVCLGILSVSLSHELMRCVKSGVASSPDFPSQNKYYFQGYELSRFLVN